MRLSITAFVLVLAVAAPETRSAQQKITRPPAPAAAKGVVDRYFRLNLDGARLTPVGCAEVDKLRIGPVAQVPDRIEIIESVGVSEAGLTAAGTAVVDVWYSEVGTLDTATAQFRSPTPGLLIRGDCELKLVGDQWKVVDPKATAFMGVQAAERHLKELLATAEAPAVRRNATSALAALKKLAGRGM